MNIKIIIKGFILALILLMNSIIIIPAPAVKTTENQNKELQIITVKIYKSDQSQNHYIYLKENQVEKLDEIFNNIKIKLENSESFNEHRAILFYAIRSFKELGLITDNMDLKEIFQILKTTVYYQILSKCFSNLIYHIKPGAKENYFCTIVAHTNGSHFFRSTGWPVSINWKIAMNNVICYGTYPFPNETDPYPEWSPAEGWVYTKGYLGNINWKGLFYGQISYDYYVAYTFYSVIGVRGFTGLRFEQKDGWVYYYGAALRVKLGSAQPPNPPPQ